ncbi:MAG: polymerase sigma70 factor [Paenibacillus sp.]|jgi:RNA polymerase sigma-70 factor (ECF subfamily)|nr:polymerase sigma70 factor [Paenibacillus sp.]
MRYHYIHEKAYPRFNFYGTLLFSASSNNRGERKVGLDYLSTLSDSTDKNVILRDLMERYGNDVWNYAFFLTSRFDQADDIFQDVFIKVYRSMFSFRGESSVKTWLLAITRNVAKDHRKSAWARRVLLMATIRRSETASSTEKEVLSRMVSGDVWKAVMDLPEKLREVLLLYAHHQLTVPEIASMLNISQGTVKSRLHRARAKVPLLLKEQLSDSY